MRHPGWFTAALGNPVIGLALMLLGLGLIYGWAMGELPILLGLFGIGLTVWTYNAFQRMQRYEAWKREWDGMGGASQTSTAHKAGLRYGLGILAYALGAWGVLSQASEPGMGTAVVLFWAATALMVVVGVYRLAKKPGARSRRDALVRVCAPSSGSSPAQLAYGQLPQHCLSVLGD